MTSNRTPTSPYFLTTKRIGFRYWTEEDFPLALGLWGDIQVTGLIGGPFSEMQIKERLTREISTQRENNIQYWPIFVLETNIHVGCCGLRPYPALKNTLELGFHLRPTFWGQGLASEAALAAINYAFNELKAEALFAGHHPENQPSKSLLCKLGFEYKGDVFYAPTGLQHPSYLLNSHIIPRKR